MSFLIRVSKPVTGVYYSTFTSKIFSPAGLYIVMILISQTTEISTTRYFDSIQEAWDWRVISHFCVRNFPIPHYEMSHFKFTKYLQWFFFIRFPKPTADTISQLPQNFSRLRRASLSTYVFFFQISKISSISFLLRHIWLTPPSPPRHISSHLALITPLDMT